MKVLGIDPGYDRLGAAVMEKIDGHEVLLYSSCIETNRKDSMPKRLHYLGVEIEKILTNHSPDVVAIETLFFGKNHKTAIPVAEVRGIVIYLAGKYGCEVIEFGPGSVKIAVTGYGSSDKKAVTDMLKRLVPKAPEKALDDEYDAIAVAVTGLAYSNNYDKIPSRNNQ